MTTEQKNLLLKDLCARLPYGVKCVSGVDDATLVINGINPECCGASEVQVTYERSGINFDTTISAIKPYLFPLSSMTEEQMEELIKLINTGQNDNNEFMRSLCRIEFYHINHFDYRGLIPMGLANDATGLGIYENR